MTGKGLEIQAFHNKTSKIYGKIRVSILVVFTDFQKHQKDFAFDCRTIFANKKPSVNHETNYGYVKGAV